MKKKVGIVICLMVLFFPFNAKAITFSQWKSALQNTAGVLQNKKYHFGYPVTTDYASKLTAKVYGSSNCASYVSWALQKAGVIPAGKMFSASRYTIYGYKNTKIFKYYVPSNLKDPNNIKSYHTKSSSMKLLTGLVHYKPNSNCSSYTQKVYSSRTAKDIYQLIENGFLQPGDIISQRDGSGGHLEVYMGVSKAGVPIIYSVGARYQTKNGVVSSSNNNYLIKNKILTSSNDCRNNHNVAQVAMVIRIRNLK